jgi:HD superfamily phosphohydrolase
MSHDSAYKIIQDPINGPVKVPGYVLKIIDSPEFQRLRNIRQLGMCHYVFPGANHTRFEHSLGTYYLSLQFSDILHIEEPELLSASALLHDLGHPPISHGIEGFFERITGLDHVDAGKQMIKGSGKFTESSIPGILESMDLSPERVCSLIDGSSLQDRLLSRIVSGPMDVDEMDYLRRDSVYCGVNVGNIDYRRIMNVAIRDQEDLYIGRKGITAVEGLLISRILMYSSVYFHKTSRIAQGMLEIALSPLIDGIDPFRMDDGDLMNILKVNKDRRICRQIIQRDLFKPILRTRYTSEKVKLLREKLDSMEESIEGKYFLDTIPPISFKGPGRVKSDLKVIEGNEIHDLTEVSPLVRTLEETMENKEIVLSADSKIADDVKSSVTAVLKDL